jgi:hypothetical protein
MAGYISELIRLQVRNWAVLLRQRSIRIIYALYTEMIDVQFAIRQVQLIVVHQRGTPAAQRVYRPFGELRAYYRQYVNVVSK